MINFANDIQKYEKINSSSTIMLRLKKNFLHRDSFLKSFEYFKKETTFT